MWVTLGQVRTRREGRIWVIPAIGWEAKNDGRALGHDWIGDTRQRLVASMWVTPEQVKNQEKGGKHMGHS